MIIDDEVRLRKACWFRLDQYAQHIRLSFILGNILVYRAQHVTTIKASIRNEYIGTNNILRSQA